MARPVSKAFVHHSVTDARTPPAQAARNIQRMHQADPKTPYSDIAYQELVAIDGTTLDGRGLSVQGGATKGHNSTSLAWCLLGNFDTERPTSAMLEALAQRLALAVTEGRLTRDFTLLGHRDANATACPGRHTMPHLTSVRSRVSEILTPTPISEDEAMQHLLVKLSPKALGAGEPVDWIVPPNGPKFGCPSTGLVDRLARLGAQRLDLSDDVDASTVFRQVHP
jgi:N-acetylmuramoyl-L-alanine amidase